MVLKLRTGDLTIAANLISKDLRTSPHTGASLSLLTVAIESGNPAHQGVLDKLAADRPLFDIEFEGTPESRWRLGRTSYHFRDGSPVRTYQWELTQKEPLSIDELWLQDIHLKPYRYVEEFEGNRLEIHACVKLDQVQRQALAALPGSFPVVRTGINEAPREMRFGRSVWSSAAPEETKAEIFLIDYDPTPRSGLIQPLLPNIESFATFSTVAVNQLLNTLADRGILDPATVATIRGAANAAASDLVFSRAYGVSDLDKWLELTAEDKKYSA
jgi:hypothetical protein